MSRTQSVTSVMSAGSPEPLLSRAPQDSLGRNAKGDISSPTDVQLSHVFQLSPDLLALGSFEPSRWLRVNPAFERLLGWAEHELIGRPLLDVVHPSDYDRFKAAEAKIQQTGGANLQIRLMCKGGGCRWIAWHIAPDTQDDSILFIGRDVTQSKRALKHLRTATVRIQRENENLEQFVRTAGHDLQEPLRTLSMYSELLIRHYGPQLPGDSIDLLSHIFGAAGRMHALVRDLLVYARVSQERDAPGSRFTDVSLEAIFGEVVEGLKSSIEEASATITHDPLPEVRGDDTQLTQLLQNLLSNSLKYRRPGVPLQIHLGVELQCGEWQFRVEDNGCGFEAKDAEGIFLDFKRLHGREIPGTGLGLPICRRIVERHGGRIWAHGRRDDGSTFWFTLPTRERAA